MNSKIILAKNIKIDREYTNVLSYTENEMLTLCQSQGHLVASANNYSFVRTTGTIMVAFTYAQCLQANYIAFQNPDYSNKWFFAWIDDVIYKGNNNTEITFTIDAWSTWYGKWTPRACFINRQHVNDDTIGLHTVPENLDVGEVIQEGNVIEDESYNNELGYYIAILTDYKIKDNTNGHEALPFDRGSQFEGVSVYDNNVFGSLIVLFKITPQTAATAFIDIREYLARTNADGHIEDVNNMFILPISAINESTLEQHTAIYRPSSTDFSFSWYTLPIDMQPQKFNTTISKLTSFNNLSIKNNKCFVYPYNYLFVSNNNGSNNIFKYEDFTTNDCVFENQLSLSVGCSGRLVPKNYKGMTTNDDESIALGKYPTCAWSSDAYTNWLTQNSVNLVTSTLLAAGGAALSAASFGAGAAATVAAEKTVAVSSQIAAGGGVGMTVAGNLANTIGQFYSATLLPNIQGGQATGDIIWSANRNKFTIRRMRAKDEYIKIIDDYFSRFGYAIKAIETPNITGRPYWNYVEIGGNEEIGYGDVPSKFMSTINSIFRRGVTIWHDHQYLGYFNLDNSIPENNP